MILTSLPDSKFVKEQNLLTIGKDYSIIKTIGNGVVIQCDDPKVQLIVLASRFE